MEKMLVVGGIIRKDNKILIAQRLPGSTNALKWEFPGGTFELGEDPRGALEREIEEELDIKIKARGIYEVVSHTYNFGEKKRHVLILYFLADYISGEPKKKYVKDFKWEPIQKLSGYDFCDADMNVVDELIKEGL